MPRPKLPKAMRSKNLALSGVLLVLVGIIYAISLMRMSNQ